MQKNQVKLNCFIKMTETFEYNAKVGKMTSMYCPNKTWNVSLVKTPNQIDAAAADEASALLLYLRDARRA